MACSGGSQQDNSFLVPHRHDLAMRCMLDPNQVYEIIVLQAEILARQAELAYRAQDNVENKSNTDNTSFGEQSQQSSEEEYAPSIYAPSDFTQRTEATTYSVATRIAGNYDKYSQPKRKYNKLKPPQRDLQPRPRSRNKGGVMEALDENRSVTSKTKESNQESPKGMQTSLALPSIVGPCMGEPLTQMQFAKEEFYNVLFLKMKLHLAEYCQNEYLTIFPTSPTPAGFVRRASSSSNMKQESAPNLSLSSSSNSSSSRGSATREVDFGSGVTAFPIRLLVDNSSFLDLAVTGSLGLINRGNGGQQVPGSPSRQKSPSHYIVLINRRSGVPLAVCALKSHHGPPVVRIYATKSRVIGQRPAASTGDLGLTWTASYPLFAWAEFTTEGEFPMPVRYSLYMASGSDGRFEKEPSYRASHPSTGSPDITMVGRTQTEIDYTGCALLSVVSDENENHGEPFLSLSISRGIDPALLICFGAIVDETLPENMRRNVRHSRSETNGPFAEQSAWN